VAGTWSTIVTSAEELRYFINEALLDELDRFNIANFFFKP
jgi:hypothetical protein